MSKRGCALLFPIPYLGPRRTSSSGQPAELNRVSGGFPDAARRGALVPLALLRREQRGSCRTLALDPSCWRWSRWLFRSACCPGLRPD